jgi:hypothetical protein
MKGFVDILCWVVGGLATIGAIYEIFRFLSGKTYTSTGQAIQDFNLTHLWLAIGLAVVAIACVVALFVRHPHEEEEIHVTK